MFTCSPRILIVSQYHNVVIFTRYRIGVLVVKNVAQLAATPQISNSSIAYSKKNLFYFTFYCDADKVRLCLPKQVWLVYFHQHMTMKSGTMTFYGNQFLVSSHVKHYQIVKCFNINIIHSDFTVHTIPWDMDYVLTTGKHCPSYEFALKKNMNESPEVQRIYSEYADLFSSWSQSSGANVATIADVFKLYNTLAVQKEHKKVLVIVFF